MRLRSIALAVLLLSGALANCRTVEASGIAQIDVQGKRNEDAILEQLVPTLKASGGVARLFYRAPASCQTRDSYPVPFPQINVQSPSKGKAGLAAIREIFRNDKSVKVTEGPPGLIRITIAEVPDAILETKIPLLNLEPFAQYNPRMAINVIENTKEVRAAMEKLGIREPLTVVNEQLVQPAKGLPHLPSSLTNVTMDEALDAVAKTFGGIVLYGTCVGSHLFTIEFVRVADFADTTPGQGNGPE